MPTKAQAKGRTYPTAKEWREEKGMVQVNAQVTPEQRKKLRMIAAARGRTISELVADMIKDLKEEN